MWPIRALGYVISFLQRVLAAVQRVFRIIDLEPSVKNLNEGKPLTYVKGE